MVKLSYVGLVLGSSQFSLVSQLPQYMMLASKVIRISSKIIILLHLSKSLTHSVGGVVGVSLSTTSVRNSFPKMIFVKFFNILMSSIFTLFQSITFLTGLESWKGVWKCSSTFTTRPSRCRRWSDKSTRWVKTKDRESPTRLWLTSLGPSILVRYNRDIVITVNTYVVNSSFGTKKLLTLTLWSL